ncbi:hypothetical protein TVAG_392690 [Trichomonas vaginalis G3]|uniref:Uncharacterized protein n=1 Tax=Trichomonas vaginalis (strain ATCC PRA-98 / G3) TaxID=412133 RepID=A2DWX0_TRIV3|nr:hypothetical protein TVAGG3_0839140 [Trichomonas vaginalis G3]EAY15152.1 hypothetical protein TVAG_392690 [Trichomonas vaginalis G3]KAI5499157.1 hypothetical protein TVAGG3_0839140 [Trichomonas vaginalis G3]|eukprot:XP_001327375.1 hypothetical protein [Trichomonas vaginalis G3]
MTPAFEDTTALKGTIEQLIDFLEKNKSKFIEIQRVLAYGGYKSQSRVFYSSLVGLEVSLKSLLTTSKGQSTTFSPDKVLELELNYKNDIDQIKTNKKSIGYADIISLYTNPSKTAQLSASNNKNEKEIFEIAKNSLSKVKVLMNTITDLSEKTVPLLQTIQNYLKSVWPALDFQKNTKKSQKKSIFSNDYNELCSTFNLVVEGMQTAILIPINDIPLRELCFETLNLLNLICKNSVKIIPKNIQLLCDKFKKLQGDFSVERLFKLNLQKYVDDLEKNKKEIMKLDSSKRELCFTRQIPVLIEFLKTISSNILSFKKEDYEVKDSNMDLAHASDGISKIIFSLSETEFNLNSFYLMNILVRLREHISSIRCGVIFDTPKDFLSTIKTIYDQISDLQRLVKVFCPLTTIKPFISSLEIVIWKLSHMKGDYKNDDLLISSLNAAIEQKFKIEAKL